MYTHLLYARHYSQPFTCIISFNPSNNPLGTTVTLPSLHPCFIHEIIKIQKDDLISPQPKVTGLVTSRARKHNTV